MLSHILLSHLYPRTCSPWLIMQPLASTAPEYSNRQNGLHVCCSAAAKNIFATTHSLCISIVPFCFRMLAVCCAAHTPCGMLQEKHRWQMAAAEAGLKVVHDCWVVHFWCGQPAAICCHAFCCPDGPVRPRLSAVCDDSCRVQLPVGRQVHMGGFCEHCHHSWRCAACSVPLVPACLCSACCKAVKTCCLPFQHCSCLTSATQTHSLSVLILVILTTPHAVPKDLLQRSQVTTLESMVWDLATTPAFLNPFCRFDTGNTLIVVYGPAEVKFTLEQLRLQWTTTSMIVFIVVLGILLGGLHWGKRYVAGLRAEAQAASVRVRWRSKAKKEPQLLVFSHALLFSAYAGLIGELPLMPCVKPGSREPVKLCSSCQSSQCKSAASYRCNPSKWPSASNKQICTTSSPVQFPDHHDTLDPYQLMHCDGSMDSIAALLNKTNHLDCMCHVSRCMECAVLQVHHLHHHSGMAKPGGRLVQLVLCAGICGQRRLLDQGHQSGLAPLLFFPHHPPHAGLLDCPVHH